VSHQFAVEKVVGENDGGEIWETVDVGDDAHAYDIIVKMVDDMLRKQNQGGTVMSAKIIKWWGEIHP